MRSRGLTSSSSASLHCGVVFCRGDNFCICESVGDLAHRTIDVVAAFTSFEQLELLLEICLSLTHECRRADRTARSHVMTGGAGRNVATGETPCRRNGARPRGGSP